MAQQRYAHFKDFSAAKLSFAEKKRVWLDISNMTEAGFDPDGWERAIRAAVASG